jgi:hypothetical protein
MAMQKQVCPLRKKISFDAEFARLCSDWISPTLPNEIWLEIFKYATEYKGSALSHPPGSQEDIAWDESLLTRRSIPLVCRQWASVGRQFLYTRLIFYRTRQLDRIMRTFKEKVDYLEWCRDVELLQIQGEFGVDNEVDFYGSALFLLQSLPRLRSLVINPLYETKCPSILRIVEAVQPKLQTLHLSSTVHGVWEFIFQVRTGTEGAHVNPYNNNWNNLQILSTLDQHWWNPKSSKDRFFGEITGLRLPAHRILCMDWPDLQNGSIFSFLRQHPFLTEVYLGGVSNEFSTFMPHFDGFVSALPKLRVLSIGMPAYMETTTTEGTQIHGSLETIIIRDISWFGRTDIRGLQPIFQKLQLGQLPSCKVIEMQGDFVDGCIDANIFIGPMTLFSWRDAIRVCKERHVSLVNETGQELFLWTDRHRVFTR